MKKHDLPYELPAGAVILDDFQIDEISLVDRPAQEGARIVMMKRDTRELVKGGGDLRLTSSVNGHSHLLNASEEGGETSHSISPGEEFGHPHPWVRKMDGTIEIGEADGHTHRALEKSLTKHEAARLLQESASHSPQTVGGSDGGNVTPEETMTKQTDSAAGETQAVTPEQFEELTKRLEKAEKFGKLNDGERAHYATLEGDAAEAWLEKSAEDRQGELDRLAKNAADENPITDTIDGVEFRKNDDPRMVELAKQAATDREELRKEREGREKDRLEKRATTEFGSLPNKDDALQRLIKAAEGIPGGEDILRAGQTALEKNFKRTGTREGDNLEKDSAGDQVMQKAAAYAKEHDVPFHKAVAEVVKDPEIGALAYEHGKSVAQVVS